MAAAGSTPERRNFSSISTTWLLSRAASSPVPMPSDRMTHSTPASVLKYVPLSPLTFSPRFFIAAMPTDTANGSASIRLSFAQPSGVSVGALSRTPTTDESFSI